MHTFFALLQSSTCLRGIRHFSQQLGHGNVRLSYILNKWINKFKSEGITDAASSAEYITAHVLQKKTLHGVNTEELYLGPGEISAIDRLSRLRLTRMPVQYVIGEWDFDGMTLKMTPPVFIPRPETEELVGHCKQILNSSPENWKQRPMLLEFGCGSGAITLALLNHFKELNAVCVDVLSEACALTKSNAKKVGVEDRMCVINGDLTDCNVISEVRALGPFSFVVSNPPYVTAEEMNDLSPEISRFESAVALNGGLDGLDIARHILHQVGSLVMPHGHVYLEVGESHPKLIENYVTQNKKLGLQFVSSKEDMHERNRYCHLQACGDL